MTIKSKYLLVLCLSSFVASCQSNNEPEQLVVPAIKDKEEVVKSPNQIDTIDYFHAWKENYEYKKAIINNINVPDGCQRMDLNKNSFGDWLRHLPLREDNTVYLYDGEEKFYQYAHYRVIEIDIGDKDLQQCADAVMRLRAEYLYSIKEYEKIRFNYTNGVNIPFSKWSSGLYPSLKGNKVVWTSSSKNNNSYLSFKKYMTNIFMYAGTASLEKELIPVKMDSIEVGDVFIRGGFPGHAVLVIDVAVNKNTGNRFFMIAQSYMPAQNIHILKNPHNSDLSPWYSVAECSRLIETPEWTFKPNQLKRFVE